MGTENVVTTNICDALATCIARYFAGVVVGVVTLLARGVDGIVAASGTEINNINHVTPAGTG
jgi:hypothetical protein